ncbi:MAG: Rieske 2Fe-2S domain-containing protein [Planctomycetes bacterium]|nr:Rieske 2Fe-2S domain-containing protein [Planctomycetota bacterium]
MNPSPIDSPHLPQEPERRSFLTRFGAICFGTVVTVFPFAAGWGVVTSPVRRGQDDSQSGGEDEGFVRICPLDAIPADGNPHAFVVIADVVDAWTRAVNQRIGEVFLTRSEKDGKPQVIAFTAACPHLGCAVEFAGPRDRYECPCHASAYAKDGTKLFGPSLRGLDQLDVVLKGDDGAQEVWVRFERFRAGIAAGEPIA